MDVASVGHGFSKGEINKEKIERGCFWTLNRTVFIEDFQLSKALQLTLQNAYILKFNISRTIQRKTSLRA